MPVRPAHWMLFVAGLWLGCVALGCQPLPIQRKGRLEQEAHRAKISSHQLRLLVNEFMVHFADRLELSADQILARESDPERRRNALLWKTNGISAGFQAASRSDPLGAFLDLWILNRQMRYLVDSPRGEELFGPWQSMASRECRRLEERLQEINQTAGANLPFGEPFVEKFAAEFPLTSLYFDREPIASRYIQEVRQPASELFQVVANLDANLEEMRKLSIVYAEYLPKQARWEAELLLIDALQVATVQRPLEDLSMAVQSISRLADVAEQLPGLVARERDELDAIVARERVQTLDELERMRQDTLRQFQHESGIALAALRDERIAVSRQLEQEVTRTLAATDDVSRERVDQLLRQAPTLIDHFVVRAGQLIAAGTLLLGIIAIMAWRVTSSRPTRTRLPRLHLPVEPPTEHDEPSHRGTRRAA